MNLNRYSNLEFNSGQLLKENNQLDNNDNSSNGIVNLALDCNQALDDKALEYDEALNCYLAHDKDDEALNRYQAPEKDRTREYHETIDCYQAPNKDTLEYNEALNRFQALEKDKAFNCYQASKKDRNLAYDEVLDYRQAHKKDTLEYDEALKRYQAPEKDRTLECHEAIDCYQAPDKDTLKYDKALECIKTLEELLQETQLQTPVENEFVNLAFDCDNALEYDETLKDFETAKRLDGQNFEVPEVVRFAGPLFSSLRERPSGIFWRHSWQLKQEVELSRSQYSLVSSNDLTAGAIQLWLGLPEEVKYDPALAPFRQFYEQEHGKLQENARKSSAPRNKRLPSVNSAPHLNNNVHVVRDHPFGEEKEKLEKLLEEQVSSPNKSKWAQAQHYTKMSLLLACWLFFTSIFLMYNEKEVIVRNSAVAPGEVKSYSIDSQDNLASLLLKISGPFLSETSEARLNVTDFEAAATMKVWIERWNQEGIIQKTDPWSIILQDETLDFSEGEPRRSTLRLEPFLNSSRTFYKLRMKTNSNQTAPFAMSYTINPLDVTTGVVYACILLCGLYILIIFEIINRTMAAVLVSTTALATLAIAGERPTLPELISWLDMETLLLLFSMMLLVAIMAETGMFDFLAVFTFEVTKGKLWPLISVLCAITAVLSTFLDNVTTVLLMTPVTIRLCECMELDPIPVLMSMVLFSNIGGTATPVGDPPNVIIASNKAVVQAGINFTNFTLHMTFGILLVCVQTWIQLRYFIYRDTNKLKLNESREIQDVRHQISIWRRAAESLPHMSRDEHVVRERLERKVKKLSSQLDVLVKESNKRACPKDTFQSTLQEMKEKYKIRDKWLLVKSSIAIGFVVTVFFLHSIPELNRVSLGWTALLGAILLLTLADREDLEPILHRVEWSTLLFFAALFVLMEALSKLGLIEFIGGLTEAVIFKVDERARLAVAILLMLWVSGVTSAFVDNIPLTTMMVRVVTSLGSNPNLNLPMAPLIWALSFGACLGGNGTLIGASANVVCAGVAEQHGYKFSFMQFFKIGFPVMIGHLIVASGYLMFCHVLFAWH